MQTKQRKNWKQFHLHQSKKQLRLKMNFCLITIYLGGNVLRILVNASELQIPKISKIICLQNNHLVYIFSCLLVHCVWPMCVSFFRSNHMDIFSTICVVSIKFCFQNIVLRLNRMFSFFSIFLCTTGILTNNNFLFSLFYSGHSIGSTKSLLMLMVLFAFCDRPKTIGVINVYLFVGFSLFNLLWSMIISHS